MNVQKTMLAVSLSLVLISGCGGSSSTETVIAEPEQGFTFDASALINNVTTNIIVAGYESLSVKGQAFHLATLTLLNTPTAENLAAAQLAWKEARIPWEQGEAHIFGPVDALSIDPHLDTWPLNTTDLQTLLETQSGFSAQVIKSWNDDVQGFHTLEFLLFGDGVAENIKSIEQLSLLEREYLAATAEVFADYTQLLASAWTIAQDPNDSNSTPYKDLLLTPSNDIYSSQKAVIEELVNGMIGIVDEVGNGKISDPFGADIDSSDTSLVESQYSWNSLADFHNNIQGVLSVYRGELAANSNNAIGISDFITASNSQLSQRIDNEIVNALTAIEEIAGPNNMPFRQAIANSEARLRIQAAIDALAIVQTSLENDVLTLVSSNEWKIQ